MLQTFLQIGKKLREDKSTVEFLPFVEFGEKDPIYDSEGKIKQEAPFVQVYDVIIDGDDWKIQKSNEPYDRNTNVTFIKGDNNDRFYIAGDIHGRYFGVKVSLEKYFKKIEKEIRGDSLSEFIMKFRESVSSCLKQIEKQLLEFNKENKNQKIFIQFRFIEGKKVFYWEDKKQDLEKVGEFMINAKYIDLKKDNEVLANRVPVSFFTNYNLNTLPELEKDNSYKIFDIRSSQDDLKNLIVADKYISGKENRFGRAVVQVLPTGKYSREALMGFLGRKVLKRDSKSFEEENEQNLDSIDQIFQPFENEEKIRKYDVLFLNKGGQTTDIVAYISSLNKTQIDDVKKQWKKAKHELDNYFKDEFEPYINSEKILEISNNLINQINPFSALNRLLRGFGRNDPKLEKHHRLVLYKLFRKQYFQDPLLLNALIEKIEYGVRNNDNFRAQYLSLLLNYIYLNFILLNNEYQKMQKTKSYKAGMLLGQLARSLDMEINSFSKQYAGNISRRIATKEDFQNLLNFIQEKLVMHEKLYTNIREKSTKLNELLANFNEAYKKDYAVAGFFYSYMMPFQKKES